MAKKTPRRRPKAIPVRVLKPVLKPIVQPVVVRLDKHEELLLEMKATLDVQFKRLAALQAQMDHLLATFRNSS